MHKKLFTLGFPHFITIETEEWREIIQGTGEKIKSRDVTIDFEKKEEGINVSVTAENSRVRSVKLRWNSPLDKKSRILGSSWERTFGDAQWRGISGRGFMPWYFLASREKIIQGYGVKVRPSAMCFWQADTRGITLVLDTRCGGTGVELKGRTLEAVQIVCMEAENCTAFEAARAFCRFLCTDPVLPPYPVYGSNNWYYAYGDSSEEEILLDTDYLCELTRGAENPPYMVIDDCWQEHHRLDEYNGGPWRKGNKKFPDMKGLAEKIKEYGWESGCAFF